MNKKQFVCVLGVLGVLAFSIYNFMTIGSVSTAFSMGFVFGALITLLTRYFILDEL